MDLETFKAIFKEIPQSEVDHFQTVPLARSTLSDPKFKVFHLNRAATHDGRGHTLTGKTWNTPDTITHNVPWYRPPPAGTTNPVGREETRAECRRFFTLGSGLNGHPDVLQGGVVSCLLDSGMGALMFASIQDQNAVMYTAQMNVSYRMPVKTPGSVVARAWVRSIEDRGRKMWFECVLESGDRGENLHAKGEALYVRAKTKGLL